MTYTYTPLNIHIYIYINIYIYIYTSQPRKINISGTSQAVNTAVTLVMSVMEGGPALLGMGGPGGMYGPGAGMGGMMGGMGATSVGAMQTFGGDAKQTMEVRYIR
jgi:hypothetical protein